MGLSFDETEIEITTGSCFGISRFVGINHGVTIHNDGGSLRLYSGFVEVATVRSCDPDCIDPWLYGFRSGVCCCTGRCGDCCRSVPARERVALDLYFSLQRIRKARKRALLYTGFCR